MSKLARLFITVMLIVGASPVAAAADDVDAIARAYVEIELGAMLVDPERTEINTPLQRELAQARAAKLDHSTIGREARELSRRLDALGPGSDRLDAMRRRFLHARLNTLQLTVRPKDAPKLSVAEEMQLRFGFTPRFRPLSDYDAALDRLDRAMPGPGTLSDRINAMKRSATVHPDKVEAVVKAAVAECRRRTKMHLPLPDELVEVRVIDDPMTPASDEFVGGGKSIARFSKSIPVDVDRLLQSACHEVYPGHHTHFANLDNSLYRLRRWPEFGVAIDGDTMFPVSEAMAEYGVGLVFPLEERIAFEREVLFPIAGLKMQDEAQWRSFISARSDVLGATATVARDFLEGAIDSEAAQKLLIRYRLQTPASAELLLKMLPAIGSYPIASDLAWYTIDRTMRGRTIEEKWRLFGQIQSEPMLLDDIAVLPATQP